MMPVQHFVNQSVMSMLETGKKGNICRVSSNQHIPRTPLPPKHQKIPRFAPLILIVP